jgi:hypothetical protein
MSPESRYHLAANEPPKFYGYPIYMVTTRGFGMRVVEDNCV